MPKIAAKRALLGSAGLLNPRACDGNTGCSHQAGRAEAIAFAGRARGAESSSRIGCTSARDIKFDSTGIFEPAYDGITVNSDCSWFSCEVTQ